MGENQLRKTLEEFVAIPVIIMIGLYMTASSIAPFLNLSTHPFTIIFTLAGGIPALTLFFKNKIRKPQTD